MVLGMMASGGLIYYFKKIPTDLYHRFRDRFIYTVKVYQYDELFDMIDKWMGEHHTEKYRDVEACVGDNEDNTLYYGEKEEPKKKSLIYKQEENMFILRYGGKKIVFIKSKEKMDKATTAKDYFFRKYTIYGFRVKKQIDKLLKEIIAYCEEIKDDNTIKVYMNNSSGDWTTSSDVKVKPLDKVVLNSATKEMIITDVNEFRKSEDWYLDASIPYKRGMIFYGPPGTGKTTMALALAAYMDRKVYCMNLNCIDDDSRVPWMFSNIRKDALLLIEDIDKIFSGRENVNTESKITFSTFLNCLDGAYHKHGLMTVVTTNHIEKLDPALLRTGRMDVKIEIPKPSAEQVSEYMSLFYKEPVLLQGAFNLSMSDVQEICIKNKEDKNEAISKILYHGTTQTSETK